MTTTSTQPIQSADGVELQTGMTVWMTWGGPGRNGLLKSVRGIIEHLKRTGRLTLRLPDGDRAHGSAAGTYVKHRPVVQKRATDRNPVRMHLNGIQECPECESLCKREHFAIEYLADDKTATYLYCEHCELAIKAFWEYTNGEWKSVCEAKLRPKRNGDAFKETLNQLVGARAQLPTGCPMALAVGDGANS